MIKLKKKHLSLKLYSLSQRLVIPMDDVVKNLSLTDYQRLVLLSIHIMTLNKVNENITGRVIMSSFRNLMTPMIT